MVLKKARYKIGDSTKKLSHSLRAKSREGHGKPFKMFKMFALEMAKKKSLLSLPSNTQLVSNL